MAGNEKRSDEGCGKKRKIEESGERGKKAVEEGREDTGEPPFKSQFQGLISKGFRCSKLE
jgi:hypothetical protein